MPPTKSLQGPAQCAQHAITMQLAERSTQRPPPPPPTPAWFQRADGSAPLQKKVRSSIWERQPHSSQAAAAFSCGILALRWQVRQSDRFRNCSSSPHASMKTVFSTGSVQVDGDYAVQSVWLSHEKEAYFATLGVLSLPKVKAASKRTGANGTARIFPMATLTKVAHRKHLNGDEAQALSACVSRRCLVWQDKIRRYPRVSQYLTPKPLS